MAAPKISWVLADNTTAVTEWKIGIVDAGKTSTEFNVLVWNNKNQATDVADMQNVSITTKDSSGGNTGDLVINKWIECVNLGENETWAANATPIGGTVTKTVRSTKSTTFNSVTSTPNVAPHNITGEPTAVCVLGVANDGTVANSAGNFLKLSLRANVPSNAPAGSISFLTRISYQYV